MEIAKNFAKALGGVLAILHDLNHAAHYGDRLILLNQGKIVGKGTAKHVLTTQNLQLYLKKSPMHLTPQNMRISPQFITYTIKLWLLKI